jgi:VIT1/CCC1 family predicted Fe2+/Mn2+ transporter
MDKAGKTGISFGLTSAVITTLGLMIGLEAGTGSKLAVAVGIITIAIADGLSDALGVHLVKESENNISHKEVWQATGYTFFYKFIFTLSFLIPVLLLPSPWATLVAIFWGLLILIFLNYYIAKTKGVNATKMILEHLSISILVIALSWLVGKLVNVITT